MHRFTRITIFTILLVLLLSLFLPTAQNPEPSSLRIADKYTVETLHLACTSQERRTGLSTFSSLGRHEGMLFSFEEERESSFWMEDMAFSIDIIWISADRRVTRIEENVPRCGTNCSFTGTGKDVLEVPAGTVSTYNITVGDPVTINATCPAR